MRDVDQDQVINPEKLERVRITGRKTPDFLKRGDILFVGRGYRIFAVLVEQDLEKVVAGPHFFIIRVNSTLSD